ncbi:MAG: L-histidine N(alpha)-methyltransferase [Rhodospirillaceae bacterium]
MSEYLNQAFPAAGPDPFAPAADGPDEAARTLFHSDVIAGLARRPKAIPCKYFYDERGSQLFDAITRTPEYYPTRAELEILTVNAAQIASLVGKGAHLIEFGSGSSHKIRLLLGAMRELASYIAVDISEAYLLKATAALRKGFPDLPVIPLCADFTQPFVLPRSARAGRKVGFFPGSTIGNFTESQARAFLHQAAAMLGAGGGFIVGVDLKKDATVLEAAYNDSAGLTAAFNLNLLRRINRELGGAFDLGSFAHRAIYNADAGRIEMYLDSLRAQTVQVGDHGFAFTAGEPIHTENSYKYSVAEFHALARDAGFTPGQVWTDRRGLFSLHFLVVG